MDCLLGESLKGGKSMKRFVSGFLLICAAIILAGCVQTIEIIDYKEVEEVGNFRNLGQLEAYVQKFNSERQSYRWFLSGDVAMENAIASTAQMSVPSAEDQTENKDHSETNNQVDGVGESDTVLTDGYYIYMISGDTVFIIDAETLVITDSYTSENSYFSGIYLYEDYLIVIGSESYEPEDKEAETEEYRTDIYYSYYYYYNYGVTVKIFDILDKNEIVLSRELFFDNSYLTDSRMIGSDLYLIMNDYSLSSRPDGEAILPRYKDSAEGEEYNRLDANDVYYMPSDLWQCSYLLLASLDVESEADLDLNAYVGSTYQIYMSQNNLYTVVHRSWFEEASPWMMSRTYVLRFAIADGKLVYQATAAVDGSPLDQFSMDEHEGYFRIATTGTKIETSTKDDVITTTWSIFNQISCFDATTTGKIEPISVLENLGKPGESIYAVRFSGDIAYVVTFVRTDPLYKIDLSDPLNPVILGELYEEGVSDYLHIINDDLLLGVGRQAEINEYGSTVFTGVKVSLYDTSGDAPINIETYLVEGEYSYTPVLYDHKAFVSYQPDGQDYTYVAIPITEYQNNWNDYLQSIYVFKVTHDKQLEYVTALSHMDEPATHFFWYVDTVDRTILIENMIYTVSNSQIRMYDMEADFLEVNALLLNQE